jgi:hypothetical protein
MTAKPAMAVYNEADIVVYIGRTQHNLNLALTNAVEISDYCKVIDPETQKRLRRRSGF